MARIIAPASLSAHVKKDNVLGSTRRVNGDMIRLMTKTVLPSAFAASLMVLVTQSVAAQSPQVSPTAARPRIDVSRLGPQVGDRVPDFQLPDQNGRSRSLASIMGAKGAMLVFIRSADW